MRTTCALMALWLSGCDAPRHAPRTPLVDPSRLPLEVLPGSLAWCEWPSTAPIPQRLDPRAPLTIVIYAPEGRFVVTNDSSITGGLECIERNLRAIRLVPTKRPIVGTLATVTQTIAEAKASVEVLTLAETDYFLLRAVDVNQALTALRRAGYPIRDVP